MKGIKILFILLICTLIMTIVSCPQDTATNDEKDDSSKDQQFINKISFKIDGKDYVYDNFYYDAVNHPVGFKKDNTNSSGYSYKIVASSSNTKFNRIDIAISYIYMNLTSKWSLVISLLHNDEQGGASLVQYAIDTIDINQLKNKDKLGEQIYGAIPGPITENNGTTKISDIKFSAKFIDYDPYQ